MGIYRFLLALFVALSHTWILIDGFNPGVVSVISFYMISGFVMTRLIQNYYQNRSRIAIFYLDRALRLLPQYLLYFGAILIFLYLVKVPSPFTYALNAKAIFLNIFIVPLEFYMWGLDGAMIIPQAWSLGLEICFYLMIPWIIIKLTPNMRASLMAASFGVFALAFLGLINTDWFGFRLLPGTLFMFLMGASITGSKVERTICAMLYVLSLFLFIIVMFNKTLAALRFNKEVLLGIVIGLPILLLVKNHQGKLDFLLGNLSYGIFLNHFIVIWALKFILSIKPASPMGFTLLFLISSILAYLSFHIVEAPVLKLRHTLRNTNKTQTLKRKFNYEKA